MSVTPLPTRRRLSPEESREAALEAARALLVEVGPQAVTLKAVAARIGRTHANLLHHFGSADGLQKALIARMAAFITGTIREAVLRQRETDQEPAEIVELAFDAFDTGGAGALASWMILTGNEDALDPIFQAIHDLVDELAAGHSKDERPLQDETVQLVLMALGDALFGAPLTRALGLPRNRARQLARNMLIHDRTN
ncbi:MULTISPECIES: TetR family transcriptional regulator [unclassified Sphingomonas]|uniref:TetR family transcriptional regulator n=1 Tax=unclassified Sphingomonas TaxID=196159 RepID=UPI000926F14B|nr:MULTISPECIES: TetR family transcriptional regulator [unclassified Sphingomonas]MBN8849071.1 TetR/AcrR family transcriptional regulator [Sphingomonas sp.]MBS0284481.1 TetR/AcrR family transcriptional regulator [Pseudomonadota bacterium]OJV29348.1 MAG: TetR family transcriptional regulator [Sphingomonas sp. 67-36]